MGKRTEVGDGVQAASVRSLEGTATLKHGNDERREDEGGAADWSALAELAADRTVAHMLVRTREAAVCPIAYCPAILDVPKTSFEYLPFESAGG